MSDQREMTLDEYLESKLPDFHLARSQLQELREERDALAVRLEQAHAAKTQAEEAELAAAQELDEVKAERDEAFAKGKQAFEDLRRVEAKLNALAAETDEWEELAYRFQAERDAQAARIAELEGYNIGLANEAHELRQQRTAMAAYVERLREAITPFAAGGAADCISRGDYSVMRERIKDWMGVKDFEMAADALRETPATSLARQKLRWQAEAVKSVRDDYCIKSQLGKRPSLYAVLDEHLEELRRQAEEAAE